MRPLSDRIAAAFAWLGAALSAAVVALALLMLSASLLTPGPALAQAMAPAMPEDDALETAIEHQAMGHPEQAARVLASLAASGHVVAMERLALLHWYGAALYGSGPWRREVAAWWFERAEREGSVLGRHMRAIVQRAGVVPAPLARSEDFPAERR